MKRALVGALLSLTMACALTSAASAASSSPGWPSISTSFSPSAVSIGQTTELTFTLGHGDGTLNGTALFTWFPTGLNVAASSSSQCGGTLTTTPVSDVTSLPQGGAAEVTLSGATLAAGGSCSFSVPVTAESAGQFTVGASVFLGSQGSSTSAVLTVPAIAAPATVTSAFTPQAVTNNSTSTWAVQIANPNASTTLTGVRFVVEMPIATAWIVPEAITGNGCGGTGILQTSLNLLTITGPFVDYAGGSIAPGATCAITVTMSTQWSPFNQVTLPVTVISNEGGTSAVSNATLSSLAPPAASVPGPPSPTPFPSPPPSKTPSNTFTHTKPNVARDGAITETVELPGDGALRMRETWRGRLIAHFQKTVNAGGKLTIKLVPSAATRRTLKSHRAATLMLLVAYTPAGGQTRTAKLTARTPR